MSSEPARADGAFLSRFTAHALDPVALLRALGLETVAPVVLLDSAGGSPQLARRHYLAWDPVFRLRVRKGAVNVVVPACDSRGLLTEGQLAELSALPPFASLRRATQLAILNQSLDTRAGAAADGAFSEREALFGLLSYDAVRYLERLPEIASDDLGLPDIDVFLPGKLLRHDIASGETLLFDRTSKDERDARRTRARVALALNRARNSSPRSLMGNDLPIFRSTFTSDAYQEAVSRTREYVFAGDIFQANLSQRLDLCYSLPSLQLYDTLRSINPSPFAGYLNLGDYELISSSPERLVSLAPDGRAETRPIAGTRPRGLRPEDDELVRELNLDPKERAEHIMLVDLERNDLGKVCSYGTVQVNELMANEYYSHVIHIVSNVRGCLHRSRDAIHLIQAMFPGGTITGCPKVRCMEIIEELEPVRRGPYTGSFGWIAARSLDLNIVIRTLVRTGSRLFLQVGGGIVADSVPLREYHETLHKATGMLRAVSASVGEHAS